MRGSVGIYVFVIVSAAYCDVLYSLSVVEPPTISVTDIAALIVRIKYMLDGYRHYTACNAHIVMSEHEVAVVVVYRSSSGTAYALAMICPGAFNTRGVYIYDRCERVRTVIVLCIYGVILHISPGFVICFD